MARNESLYDCYFLFSDFEDIPLTAAQDLGNILKQGYLEKKRRGISNGGHLLLAAEVGGLDSRDFAQVWLLTLPDFFFFFFLSHSVRLTSSCFLMASGWSVSFFIRLQFFHALGDRTLLFKKCAYCDDFSIFNFFFCPWLDLDSHPKATHSLIPLQITASLAPSGRGDGAPSTIPSSSTFAVTKVGRQTQQAVGERNCLVSLILPVFPPPPPCR